ncbi:MAG: hypothetical protein HQL26_07825 [Candidatus Omnitrophica bacterium]|nr:hypothetical protein [Candidatus Omnitrophota bacterium]
MLVYGLLILGIASRLFVHVPNFSPVIAIALFSGMYVDKKYAVWLPVVLMAVTDMILGWHATVLYTWGSIGLIAWFNFYLRDRKTTGNVVMSSLLSATLFYVFTNLGVWLTSGMYPMDARGLVDCYAMAVPFFRWSLVSTVVYALVLHKVVQMSLVKVQTVKI